MVIYFMDIGVLFKKTYFNENKIFCYITCLYQYTLSGVHVYVKY